MKSRYEMYLSQASRVQEHKPSMRWGQALFNVLQQMDPELAKQVRGTNIDPFFLHSHDKRINRFLAFVEVHWEGK